MGWLKRSVGFSAGVVLANGFEWYAHKFVLHGIARPGKSRFSPYPPSMASHWTHHKLVRKNLFHDDGYVIGLVHERTRLEVTSLALVAGVAAALAWPINRATSVAFCYSAANYFLTHRRAHLDPLFAQRAIPWHYDHHMNSNQDANWCVTRPWFDYIMGTRVASSSDLLESNPTGFPLPYRLEAMLNQTLERLFPVVFERVRCNLNQERRNRLDGLETPDES